MAASHKYAMAAVQTQDYLLVRSHPCDDPECKNYSSQCTTLHNIERGDTKAHYTKNNAQFHWGVTPRTHWSLFNLKNDAKCENDLSANNPELTEKLAKANNQCCDDTYPVMIEAGGDDGKPILAKKAGTQD